MSTTKTRNSVKYLLFLFTLLTFSKLEAYPQFVVYGYKNCSACHFNPLGNGPLTDYGRAVSATELAAAPLYRDIDPEKLAKYSGFLGDSEILPAWLRPSLDYRGMEMWNAVEKTGSRPRYITMQADASLTLNYEKWVVTGTLGYVPVENRSASQSKDAFVTREHYVSYTVDKNLWVGAGLMDVAYGIRIPDHVSFSRSRTTLAQNDQSHGVLIVKKFGKWQSSFHALVGNLISDKEKQQKGFSWTNEFEVASKSLVGFSLLQTRSDAREKNLFSIHSRLSLLKSTSLLSEVGLVRDSAWGGGPYGMEFYTLNQSYTRLLKGLFLLINLETLTQKNVGASGPLHTLMMGPSLLWWPMQRVELRVDLRALKQESKTISTPFTWSAFVQSHLWF